MLEGILFSLAHLLIRNGLCNGANMVRKYVREALKRHGMGPLCSVQRVVCDHMVIEVVCDHKAK